MSKIKCLIFDLDNTLVDLSEMHRLAFTNALVLGYGLFIEEDYHRKYLEGLPTKEKLKKLGVPEARWKEIIDLKQETTFKEIEKILPDTNLISILDFLKKNNYKVWCCSNSLRITVQKVLSKLQILKYFDGYIGNDDVFEPKPSPSMYWKVCSIEGIKISEILIVEDSFVGELAIDRSGGNKFMVKNSSDLIEKILDYVKTCL